MCSLFFIIVCSHHIGGRKRPVCFSACISADVIHTVGPIAQGRVGEEEKKALRACYRNSLEAAASSGARSVVRWMDGWRGGWADVRFDLRNWELNGREPLKSLKFRCENRDAGKQHERENKKKPEINRG